MRSAGARFIIDTKANQRYARGRVAGPPRVLTSQSEIASTGLFTLRNANSIISTPHSSMRSEEWGVKNKMAGTYITHYLYSTSMLARVL